MANESYSEFVSGLQSEIERDTNIRFGIVEKHSFANVKRTTNDNFGEAIYMGYDKSEELYRYLVKEEYITKRWMRKLASKLMVKYIRKQFEVNTELELDELKITYVDGDVVIKTSLELRMNKQDSKKILSKIDDGEF